MKVDAARGKLYDGLKQLQHRWDIVLPLWNDTVRAEFEKDIWQPLQQLTDEVMQAMDRLTQVFHQLRKACSDDSTERTLFS